MRVAGDGDLPGSSCNWENQSSPRSPGAGSAKSAPALVAVTGAAGLAGPGGRPASGSASEYQEVRPFATAARCLPWNEKGAPRWIWSLRETTCATSWRECCPAANVAVWQRNGPPACSQRNAVLRILGQPRYPTARGQPAVVGPLVAELIPLPRSKSVSAELAQLLTRANVDASRWPAG